MIVASWEKMGAENQPRPISFAATARAQSGSCLCKRTTFCLSPFEK
jgi:hypothetical protein